jgi:hypothetical protein
VRRTTAGALALLLAAACSSGGDDSASTTTATTTTLPPSQTTSTLPPRAALDVDVCSLLNETELQLLVEEPGPGETTDPDPDPDAGPPALLTGQCSWPSVDEPQITLHYLAPTTAADGPSHLNDVVALDRGFGDGASVITQELRGQTVGLLVDADGHLREVAVKKRSALLYLVLEEEVDGRDQQALDAYADLVVTALIRAPR